MKNHQTATSEELAKNYFRDWELVFAASRPDPVETLEHLANESMRGHINQSAWVETSRKRVNVYLEGRSPGHGKPSISLSTKELASVAWDIFSQNNPVVQLKLI